MLRYVYSLAERLHIDEDVILYEWPGEKLRRWQINDEVSMMAQRLRNTNMGQSMSEGDVWDAVRDEQVRCDYAGIVSIGDDSQ